MVRPLVTFLMAAILCQGVLAVPIRAIADDKEAVSDPPMAEESPFSNPLEGGREPASLASEDTSDDEYNFSWLDPDKKVYVLQNRKYRKKGHVGIFAAGGMNLNNPYRTEWLGVPRAAYWFSEQFGFEVFYAYVNNSDNATMTSLKTASDTLPFVRENQGYYGGLLTWTPWYAKINFFNKILYFDWFLDLGMGQVTTALDLNTKSYNPPNLKTENIMAYYFGTGQNFFVTRDFSVRWDLIGMAYNATALDGRTTRLFTNFDFTLGVGYLF